MLLLNTHFTYWHLFLGKKINCLTEIRPQDKVIEFTLNLEEFDKKITNYKLICLLK